MTGFSSGRYDFHLLNYDVRPTQKEYDNCDNVTSTTVVLPISTTAAAAAAAAVIARSDAALLLITAMMIMMETITTISTHPNCALGKPTRDVGFTPVITGNYYWPACRSRTVFHSLSPVALSTLSRLDYRTLEEDCIK